jgi:hypothetical protein
VAWLSAPVSFSLSIWSTPQTAALARRAGHVMLSFD